MEKHARPRAQEPVYDVVWPLGRRVFESVRLRPRFSDLNGKTVGEVWDWAFRGDEMFPVVREKLRERYPDIKFVDYTAFGDTHGQKEAEVVKALPDRLREYGCDVVISGVGA